MDLISVYIRENQIFTKAELKDTLCILDGDVDRIIDKLTKVRVLKRLTKEYINTDFMELLVDQIDTADSLVDNVSYYSFLFVGIIAVENLIIKCYPKYLINWQPNLLQMKQVMDVLHKAKRTGQNVDYYNGLDDKNKSNLLPIVLYLLYDYYENGVYKEEIEYIENNGDGEILWEKTINETFALISNRRPYHLDIFDRKTIDDDQGIISRLHKSIINECSLYLYQSDISELLGFDEIKITDELIDDLGDKEYLKAILLKELSVQFNTRNQILIKTMFVYLDSLNAMKDENAVNFYGTSSFHVVWERICKEVFRDQLDTKIKELPLKTKNYSGTLFDSNSTLIRLIEHPRWLKEGMNKPILADKTLIPDAVGIYSDGLEEKFIIFDAKYYNLKIDYPNILSGQPGIESITKQYLYQLAYNEFIDFHNITYVRNLFVLPTENDKMEKASVSLNMFESLDVNPKLQAIQVRKIPARQMFSLYLEGKMYNIDDLEL